MLPGPSFLILWHLTENNTQRSMKLRKQNEEREKIHNEVLRKFAGYLFSSLFSHFMDEKLIQKEDNCLLILFSAHSGDHTSD